MEDHQNATRLGVTAAYARCLPNFASTPPTAPVTQDVTIYHAQPHGNVDPLRRPIVPDLYVNIESVLPEKRSMLACHRSQKEWLDRTQGMESYLNTMEEFGRETGELSGRFAAAEGWRRHLHLGFCAANADPLADALARFVHAAE
jgi:LmbE family N-acetylglucosaminyl deacetylase